MSQLHYFLCVCVQDVEQVLLGQTAGPGGDCLTVVTVISGLGLVTVLLVTLELTAAQVGLKNGRSYPSVILLQELSDSVLAGKILVR